MGYYAAFLDVTARPCLVVGGGQAAVTKVRGLLDSGACVTVVGETFVEELEDLERQHRILLVRRRFTDSDLDQCFLVIDASGDEATAAQVSRAAHQRKVLVNILDRPAYCDFIAPALVRRGPLQVAISTSGRSPFLASAIRRSIERWFGPEWGPMVELMGKLRDRLRRQGISLPQQIETFARAFASGALDDLRAGRLEEAETAIDLSAEPGPGWVALVGAGPGDPRLLTVRAMDLLARAQVVFHDALIEPSVLAMCNPSAALIRVGKRSGKRSAAQEEIHRRMIQSAREGHFVVRLKGGDPFVFGRGGEEVLALAAAGVSVEVVPGISSALAGPALAGVPLTHRGLAASFAVITARRSDGSIHDFGNLTGVDTLVVMMVVDSLELVTRQLIHAGRGVDCPAALVEAASTARERVLRSNLSDIAALSRQAGIRGPAILVVGDVVRALSAATLRLSPVEAIVAGS